jgi:hypothetical protein
MITPKNRTATLITVTITLSAVEFSSEYYARRFRIVNRHHIKSSADHRYPGGKSRKRPAPGSYEPLENHQCVK